MHSFYLTLKWDILCSYYVYTHFTVAFLLRAIYVKQKDKFHS